MSDLSHEELSERISNHLVENNIVSSPWYKSLTPDQRARFKEWAHVLVHEGLQTGLELSYEEEGYGDEAEQLINESRIYLMDRLEN